jgi:hypothetical protein
VILVQRFGPECLAGLAQSFDGGDTWQSQFGTDGVWHLQGPGQADSVHAPQGDVPSPCAPGSTIDLQVGLASSAVLCADGRVFTTGDGGITWQLAGQQPGARAIAYGSDDEVRLASVGLNDCDGVAVGPVGGNGDGACMSIETSGPLGMAFLDQIGVLVSEETVWRTEDGGATWSAAR